MRARHVHASSERDWFAASGLHAIALVVVFGLLGLAAPVGADEQGGTDRVSILDAGTFLVVEARQAPLGRVLDRLAKRLNVALSNSERLDLARIVNGRVRGSVFEVVLWLVPETNFLLVYGDAKGDTHDRPLERIAFLGEKGKSGLAVSAPTGPVPSATGAPGAPKPAMTGGRGSSSIGEKSAGVQPDPDLRRDGSKPDVASSRKSEIKSVAEQLEALTPGSQLAIERQAHTKDGANPPPEFLRPKSDAAQTTVQQQAERSQAIAVEQLRALMEAYRTACANPPCPLPGTPATSPPPAPASPNTSTGARPEKAK